jgi:hypothetical protein
MPLAGRRIKENTDRREGPRSVGRKTRRAEIFAPPVLGEVRCWGLPTTYGNLLTKSWMGRRFGDSGI